MGSIYEPTSELVCEEVKKVSSKRDVREMGSEEVQFLGGNDPAEIKSPRLRTQRK